MGNSNSRAQEQPPEGAPQWMVTYGDMMTLLLCFFVILVAISEVKEEKFHKVMESIREYLGHERADIVEPGKSSAGSLMEYIRRIQNETGSVDHAGAPANSVLGQHVMVQTLEEGGKIVIGGEVLFEEGSAQLKISAFTPLNRLVRIVDGYTNKLEIRGHASIEKIAPEGPIQDLFDLGYARAKAAAEYLIEQGIDARRIRLYSGGSFDRPESNLTYQGKEANRRVEVIVSEELIPLEGAGGD